MRDSGLSPFPAGDTAVVSLMYVMATRGAGTKNERSQAQQPGPLSPHLEDSRPEEPLNPTGLFASQESDAIR